MTMRQQIANIPVLGGLLATGYRRWIRRAPRFTDSTSYWDERYRLGGHSGDGSYGKLAEFKARVINEFVTTHDIQTLIELGCGDGNQLSLAQYPHYIGLDVSPTAVANCRRRFATDESKQFFETSEFSGDAADCALSLDVILHLVEDDVFDRYMHQLFGLAEKFVIIYSSNHDGQPSGPAPHVRHRRFTDWIDANRPESQLMEVIDNELPFDGNSKTTSLADFYFYRLPPKS